VTSFPALADERFISLTTFRQSGEPVSTPVWVARDAHADGDALIVTTPADSGKVKRLRHTARVEMRPASRSGKVPEGAEPVAGTAQILAEDRPAVFRAKYGLEYRIFMVIERLDRKGNPTRVLLRITPE
jgi:uncharacterized protein